jgi:adenine-specific DNA methylase
MCNASRYKRDDNIKQDSYNNKRKGRKRKNTTPPDQDNQGSKERKHHALVLWYLPVIDRLKHMFSNAREAQLLLWHVQQKRDGKILHPADGRQWKHFDLSHEEDFLMIQGILGLVLAWME